MEKNPNIKWHFNDAKNFLLDKQQKDYYEKLGFWCTLTDLTSDSKK